MRSSFRRLRLPSSAFFRCSGRPSGSQALGRGRRSPPFVVATKGGLLRPRPSAWDPDGRPEHLKKALEGSLKRLKLERIDLYQLHAPDPKVPFAESVGALADAQKAGKISHIGISNVSVKQLEEA